MRGSRTNYSRTYTNLTVTILFTGLAQVRQFFEGTERFGFNGLLFQLSGYFQIVKISECYGRKKMSDLN